MRIERSRRCKALRVTECCGHIRHEQPVGNALLEAPHDLRLSRASADFKLFSVQSDRRTRYHRLGEDRPRFDFLHADAIVRPTCCLGGRNLVLSGTQHSIERIAYTTGLHAALRAISLDCAGPPGERWFPVPLPQATATETLRALCGLRKSPITAGLLSEHQVPNIFTRR
jgi:hypothetical protein